MFLNTAFKLLIVIPFTFLITTANADPIPSGPMALKSRGILDLLPCTACRECPNTIGRCPNCPRFETYRCTNVLDALEELASATPTKLKPRIAINPPAAAKHRKRQGLGDLFDLGNLGDLPSLLDQLGLEGLDLDGLLSLDCTNEETLMGLYDLIEALLDYSALGLLDGSLDGYLDLGTGLYSLNVEQRVALEGYLLCGCKDVWTLITEDPYKTLGFYLKLLNKCPSGYHAYCKPVDKRLKNLFKISECSCVKD